MKMQQLIPDCDPCARYTLLDAAPRLVPPSDRCFESVSHDQQKNPPNGLTFQNMLSLCCTKLFVEPVFLPKNEVWFFYSAMDCWSRRRCVVVLHLRSSGVGRHRMRSSWRHQRVGSQLQLGCGCPPDSARFLLGRSVRCYVARSSGC